MVHGVLQSTGEGLSPAARGWAEPLFGRNLAAVRVHTDATAAESARSMNALAYTVGQHMVFDRGHYSPETPAGRKLLTHELTHTIQQSGVRSHSSLPHNLEISNPTDASEREADSILNQARPGFPVQVQQRVGSLVQRSVREILGDVSIGLGAAAAIGGGIALASGHSGGGWALGLGIAGIVGGLLLRSKPLPPPTDIRVVQNHQVPLDAAGVRNGRRSGYGGVSEIQVSNDNVDYDGSQIQEHFVRGHCENANRSGQGGTGGSTFTVGQGVSNNDLGTPIAFPAKHNTFYDQHVFASDQNVIPPGQNDIFSICVQQYTFDGHVIAGKIFLRRYDIHRDRIDGQDVAVFRLSTSEEGPTQPPPAQPAAPTQPAAPSPTAAPSAPSPGQPGQ
jgi:hypothetical protein